MKTFRYIVAFMVTAALVSFQVANADAEQDMAQAKKIISAKLLKINPKFQIESIATTRLADFYTVQIVSGPKLYMEKSGNHFFDGTLFDISSGNLVNVTEQEAAVDRLSLLKEFNPKEMIIFSPKAPVKTKVSINVFTDVDCFYCQKLHKEVPELNAMGIEVRYLAFPRAGLGSPSYNKIVSAWCADDPNTSLTKLKNREEIPAKTCDNPVAKQYDLGQRMGVSGTPAIVLNDGTLIPGYRPAAKLAEPLGL